MSRAALLYDSGCGFCRWSVSKIVRWDREGRLRLVAIESPEGDALLTAVDRGRRLSSWHLVDVDGRVHSGGAVAEPLLRLLPGCAWLAFFARSSPGVVNRVYRLVAGRRARAGRLVGARCEAGRAPGSERGPAASKRGSRSRAGLGGALVALGVLLLAYAVTVAVWRDPVTDLYTRWKQRELSAELDSTLAREARIFGFEQASLRMSDGVVSDAPTVEEQLRAEQLAVARAANRLQRKLKLGKPLGRIVVPRLGLRAVFVEGTRWGPDLSQGPGHYAQSSLPGVGRTTAIAGHRTTFGAPFRHIDSLRAGDQVAVSLPYATFHYRVTGHKVVENDDWSIIRDRGSDVLVLSACHPLYSAARRWAVFAGLVRVEPVGGRPYRVDGRGALHAAG